jgi:hypothetical protein
MFRKSVLTAAAAVAALSAIPATAEARPRGSYNDGYYGQGYGNYGQYDRYGRGGRYDTYGNRSYGRSAYGYNDGYYRGNSRCSGTTGTIVGGVAGALAGRAIDRNGGRGRYGRRDSGTTGAIIGGAIGALAGRAVDKSSCGNSRYRY